MIESNLQTASSEFISKLKYIPALSGLDDSSFLGFMQFSKIRQFDPGEFIINEGSVDRWIYFLIFGKVKIVKDNLDLAVLDRYGDLFGEMAIIDDSVRSANICAVDKTVCLASDISYLDQINEAEKYKFGYLLYQTFSRILSDRLREQNNILWKLSSNQNDQIETDLDDATVFKSSDSIDSLHKTPIVLSESSEKQETNNPEIKNINIEQSYDILEKASQFIHHRPFIELKEKNGNFKLKVFDGDVAGRTGVGKKYFIQHNHISRHHIRVFKKRDQWYIEDLDTVNGTFVGGNQIDAYEPYQINKGDHISLSSHSKKLTDYIICQAV